MKQRLTSPRSCPTVSAHHIVFLLLLSLLCCSRAHSKVIQTKHDLDTKHDLHPKKHLVDKNHLLQKLKNYLDHAAGHKQSAQQIKKDLNRKLDISTSGHEFRYKENQDPLNSDHHREIIEDFKAKILRHLGLNAPPPVTSQGRLNASVGRQIREFMRSFQFDESDHLHDRSADAAHDRSNVNKTETFIFHTTDSIKQDWVLKPDTRRPTVALRTFQFSTHFHQPEVPYLDLVMKSALLRMRINVEKHFVDRAINVIPEALTASLYIQRKPEADNISEQASHSVFLATFPVPQNTKSVEIPLNPEILSHLVDLKDQTIVFIVAIGNEEKNNSVDSFRDERDFKNSELIPGYNLTRRAKSHKKLGSRIGISHAVLEVSTETRDLRRSRARRQTKEPSCQENLCCRNSIYITFKDIGWDDWVLAPEGYTAYFCKGGCPHRYKSASTFSGIKGLLHLSKPSIVPEPTCAASGYTSITLLHMDEEGELVSTKYPEMVVTGCRCY